MSYEAFRTFADTWGLVLLAVLFFAMLIFVFRRGTTERYRRAGRIPIEAPESPAPSDQEINDLKTDIRDEREEPGSGDRR